MSRARSFSFHPLHIYKTGSSLSGRASCLSGVIIRQGFKIQILEHA
jgi:hypothetical protein